MDIFDKLKNLNMLLIDDDEWIRDSMSLFFEGEGCYLKTLETAEEGLDELKKMNYDIIFIDYKLPGINGLTFLEHIEDLYPDMLKIIISAYGLEIFRNTLRVKFHDFIQKPFTSEDIKNSLTRLINRRRYLI